MCPHTHTHTHKVCACLQVCEENVFSGAATATVPGTAAAPPSSVGGRKTACHKRIVDSSKVREPLLLFRGVACMQRPAFEINCETCRRDGFFTIAPAARFIVSDDATWGQQAVRRSPMFSDSNYFEDARAVFWRNLHRPCPPLPPSRVEFDC